MMNLNPRIERLKQMMALEEKRAALQDELDSISNQMSVLKDQLLDDVSSLPAQSPKTPTPPRTRAGKRQGRGLLKEKIMTALEAAGDAGVKVKELASALGTKPVNVYSWFHSALQRNEPIEKITGGHYRLDGDGAAPVKKRSDKPAAKPSLGRNKGAVSKGKPRRRTRRGQFTNNILGALKEAGNSGISVADLSDKLGIKYKNVYIWFATTGKKNPSVKKVGPAKFKLAA